MITRQIKPADTTNQIRPADIKMLLQACKILQEKVLFSCTPARSCKILQDPTGSCGILWDFAGILQDSCTKFLQDSCKIPAESHKMQDLAKILQDLARVQEKKDLFLQDLARAFLLGHRSYKARKSCRSYKSKQSLQILQNIHVCVSVCVCVCMCVCVHSLVHKT